MARYDHAGAAPETTLVGDITATSTALTIANGTGYPVGGTKKFWIVIDPEVLGKEEKILVNSRTGTALSLTSSTDRGQDGTVAVSHKSGAKVRHILSAVEADEANAHVNDITLDQHPQYAQRAVSTDAFQIVSRSVKASDAKDGLSLGTAKATIAAALAALPVGASGQPVGRVICLYGDFDLGSDPVGIELGYNGFALEGAGREMTTFSYDGIGTAIQFANHDVIEPRRHSRLTGFTLNAPNAAIGIDRKGNQHGYLHDYEIVGAVVEGDIVAGSIGVLNDASLDETVGCWWNTAEQGRIIGFDTCVKYTGVETDGQANQNVLRDVRLGLFNIGVHVDCGDTVVLDNVDATSSVAGAVGLFLNHRETRVVNGFRSEQTDTAIRVGPNAKRVVIEPSTFSGNTVAIEIQAGAEDTFIHDGSLFTGVGTKYLDNGTQTRAIRTRMVGANLLARDFIVSNLPANGTTPLQKIASLISDNRYYIGNHYQYRGCTVRASVGFTGTVTIQPQIVGIDTDFDFTLTATGEKWQGIGRDTNNGAGGLSGNVITSGLSPAGSLNLEVTMYVELVREAV